MNITLIGMPGVGKTSIGKELAKKLEYIFLDLDDEIEKRNGLKLQQIIDKFGDEKFMEKEEETILDLGKLEHYVLSPGGSVVYSKRAMEFLGKISTIVFLDAPLEQIKERLGNMDVRGIVGLKTKTLDELFYERRILYRKYANLVIEIRDSDTQKNALAIFYSLGL
jgi:shikimate kinase